MLDIGRKILSLENAMYELEEIICESWTIESKSNSELQKSSPNCLEISSWLSSLEEALKKLRNFL